MRIENQTVCVLCGDVNPASRWISLPVHSQCARPSEISNSYKAYSMLAGLSVEAIRDLCRQMGVQFTYRYKNANGKKSRLFHDKSYLVYQIVRVKGASSEAGQQATAGGAEGAEAGDAGDAGDGAEGATAEAGDDTAGEAADAEADTAEEQEEQAARATEAVAAQTPPKPAPRTEAARSAIVSTCEAWIKNVQLLRAAASKRGMKVVISPRASIRGSLMLSKGIDVTDVAALEIGNRMAPTDWANLKIEAGVYFADPKPPTRTRMSHKQTDLLAALVKLRINVWLKGPAGSGKTTAARLAAQAAGLPFYFTGAIDSKYDLTGFVDAQGRIVNTQYRKAFSQGGVFLFDELDASQPNALLAFNSSLANGYADFPGSEEPIKAHPDFTALVGANTIGAGATAEYSGRFKQDAAFCDRFAMLLWDYDTDLEREIALAGVA
jgi:hypothetical protein